MNLFATNLKKAVYTVSIGGCFLLLTSATNVNNIAAETTTLATYVENGTGFATVESYIARYKHIAIEEMQNVGIPASIKLAQAIIESRYGNSDLAVNANNHFGIKCGSTWNGLTVIANDDRPDECFRKYRNSYESYIDHSQFLEQPRYAALFNLVITDYKSWARGLSNAGYATNPNYANMLIEVIERHELYKIDQEQAGKEAILTSNSPVESSRQFEGAYALQAATAINRKDGTRSASGSIAATEPMYYNGIKTIILENPATAAQVQMLYGIDADKICQYNNVQPNELIPANTKIYLQPMRNKAAKNVLVHTVASGETMEEISQYYGVKLNKLYSRNKMKEGMQPAVGQVVYLRGKAEYTPLSYDAYENPPLDYKPKTKSKVIIAETPVNTYSTQTTVNNNSQPSATTREYYDTKNTNSNASANTNETEIKYFNNNENSSSGYGSYKPVKEKVTEVVNTVKEYIAPTTTPEVVTYHSSNNNGKTQVNNNNSNVVVSKPNTTTNYNSTPNNNNGYLANTNTDDFTYFDTTTVKNNTTTTYTTPTATAYTTTTTASNTTSATSQTIKHEVVKGDTLYNISKRHNTTVEKIKQLNDLYDNTIKLGQLLTVVTNTVY